MLPSLLAPDRISNYQPRPPDEISGNTLAWTFDSLEIAATQLITFDVLSPTLTGANSSELLNIVEVAAPKNILTATTQDSVLVTILSRTNLECYLGL